MSTLVTGATGFIGTHLLQSIKKESPAESIFCVSRNTAHLPAFVKGIDFDLASSNSFEPLLKQIKPTRIYHLAGIAKASGALKTSDYFYSNFRTTERLAEALANYPSPVSLFFSSSVHVYGNQHGVVTESVPPNPINGYGFTKYLAEKLLKQLSASNPNIRVVIGRLYSTFGPLQKDGYAIIDFCKKIARLNDVPGQKQLLEVGPLHRIRHFMDVRDAVKIFQLLLSRSQQGCTIFNVSPQQAYSLKEALRLIIAISKKNVDIKVDSQLHANQFNGVEVCTKKLVSTLGPKLFRDFKSSLEDTYQSVNSSNTPQDPFTLNKICPSFQA